MSDAKLGLLTDDELIEELARRFEHLVIAGRRVHEHIAAAARERWKWKGDHRMCQGLCVSLQATIEGDYQKRATPS